MPDAPSLLSRGGARAVDAFLLAVLGVAWGYPLDYSLVWLVAHALLVYGSFVAGDALVGGTPGKAALGLRVVGADGEAPSWAAAAKREAFVLLGAVPFVGPLIALGVWAWIARDVSTRDDRRGVHDRFAGGTEVVSAR